MDFPNLGTNPELDDIMQRAKEFNIEDNLLDLVMYGFTVVPPEKMGASDLTPRLRDAILEVYERRSGHSIDDWKTYSGKLEKFQAWGWLLENDVFLEAIHNPVYQTIGQFLTGKSGFLAGASVILKTQDLKRDLPLLHSDSHGVPSPWPSFATYANLSWLLTDYLSRKTAPPYSFLAAIVIECRVAMSHPRMSRITITSNLFPWKGPPDPWQCGMAPCGMAQYVERNPACASHWSMSGNESLCVP